MEFLKAIKKNDIKKVEKYLKKGINPDDAIEDYESKKKKLKYDTIPLCLAASKGHVEIARMLLNFGADVEASNKEWSPPIHVAAFYGHLEMMKLLILRNVNLNRRDSRGNTPLHIAVRNSHIDCVSLLLNYDIDLNVENVDFNSASDLARINCKPLILHLISQKHLEKKKQANYNNNCHGFIENDTIKHISNDRKAVFVERERLKQKSEQEISIEREYLQRKVNNFEDFGMGEQLKHEIREQEIVTKIGQLDNVIREQENYIDIRINKKESMESVLTEIAILEGEIMAIEITVREKEEQLKLKRNKLFEKQSQYASIKQELDTLNSSIESSSFVKEVSYECPVCFEVLYSPKKIYQCPNGHIICSECKKSIYACPQCRVQIICM